MNPCKALRPLVTVMLYFFILFASAQSPSAGANVNMVSGTVWTTGDPFLQRQNEPSSAVSTRNPLHLPAGANDSRTVDLRDCLESMSAAMPGLASSNHLTAGKPGKALCFPD